MIRKFLLSLSILSAGFCLAAPLTPEEALNRVNGNGLVLNTRGGSSLTPAKVLKTKIGEPALYVFDLQETPGFMVVSADDAVIPLLGYSDNNSLNSADISPAMQNWLDKYVEQIEFARKNQETGLPSPNPITLPNWNPISPMLKTQWNQNAPYYNKCPQYGGQYCNTGCVATAMAQVMNYFQYPAQGQGKISYLCSSLGRTLTLDFSTITFDWKNMLNSYSGTYNDTQANAVATLMQAAGYSVEMSYSTGTSGAVSGMINGALVKYFGYDNQAYYAVRDLYPYTEWATMIYNNLKNVGPVIYDGTGGAGGHSFVCDGYQGNGYFHFNWGWGGSGDGYFLLDALNPSSIGIGGGGGGFNFDQDCVLNIRKPVSGSTAEVQNMMMIYGSVEGYFNNSDLLTINLVGSSTLGWAYKGLDSMVADLGATFEPVNSSSASTLNATSTNTYNKQQMFEPISYMPIEGSNGVTNVSLRPTFRLSNIDLVKGVKYKVTNSYLPKGSSTWLPVEVAAGSYNYFYLTKTGDGNKPSDFEIENFYPMQFDCSNLSFEAQLYNGIAAQVSVTLTNNNSIDLTRGVCLVLYDESGKLRFKGDAFVMSLAPGETYTENWISVLTAQTSTTVSRALELYAGLYDPETDTEYYMSKTPVTMEPNPGRPTYTTSIKIDNAEYSNKKYIVDNSSNFDVNFEINVTKNIFSYNVMLWIATLSGNQYYRVLYYPLDAMVVDAGQSGSVDVNMSFPDAVVGETYYIVSLVNNGYDNSVPFVALANGSEAGVEELIVNDEEPVIFYDSTLGKVFVNGNGAGIQSIDTYAINGMKLSPKVSYAGDNAEIDVSSLGKGIIVVNVTDNKGNRKTAKLAL